MLSPLVFEFNEAGVFNAVSLCVGDGQLREMRTRYRLRRAGSAATGRSRLGAASSPYSDNGWACLFTGV